MSERYTTARVPFARAIGIDRTSGSAYSCPELTVCHRPGALDSQALPSRMGQRLHHRDGRITDLNGNPIAPLIA